MDSSSDSTYNALPVRLQRRIDHAFTSAVQSEHKTSRSTLHSSATNPPNSGGGFIAEHTAGGGFVNEDISSEIPENATHIRMSLIPVALQRLDHPPDDEQVLSVFRNAASGWSSSSNNVNDSDVGEGLVSLEDWRTVCAVLFEHHNEEYEDDSEGDLIGETAHTPEDVDDDQYVGSSDSGSDSDDEYTESLAAPSSRQRTRRRRAGSSSGSPEPSTSVPTKITPRQKQTCLEAFALFFPSVPIAELASQKLMIKDIQRITKILGEKIKADEMVEMLAMFSTSPDKSMNLSDFEHMMVAARLA